MIALVTGRPTFEQLGDNVLLSFPSGEDGKVTVCLTRNQLASMQPPLREAVSKAFEQLTFSRAEVIEFCPSRGKSRRKK